MKSPLRVVGGEPFVAVVAGHDPSAGAGVTADAEALRRQGASGGLVVSAWTQQDHERVRELGARPAGEWLAEARALQDENTIQGLKLGLLPGYAAIEAVATWIQELRARQPELPVVVDPVLVSSSGFRFVDELGLDAYRRCLVPLGLVWTPNLMELGELVGSDRPDQLEDRAYAGHRLLEAGAAGVVVTGGHGAERPLKELVLDRQGETWLEQERLEGNLRGSGCRHATTLAVELAQGRTLAEAAQAAARAVHLRWRADDLGAF